MTQVTTISHNSQSYDLNIGLPFKHLDSDPLKALQEICIDDIFLPNEKKAGEYKLEKKAEYKALLDKSNLSNKKYLNRCSTADFGYDWDNLIDLIKKNINEACIHLLHLRRKRSEIEQYQILGAANNGHVAAMYYIGTALSDGQDDNCLFWLSMAHNRGHLGACFEISKYLSRNKNFLDSLRCLIISADSGFDIAYITLFDISIITNMLKIQDLSSIEAMLDELLQVSNYSGARYFKGIISLLQEKRIEGKSLLKSFMQVPKRQLQQNKVDDSYDRQIQMINSFIENLIQDIDTGIPLLNAINHQSNEANFSNFKTHDELVKEVDKKLRVSD
jgi:hypothetical protein